MTSLERALAETHNMSTVSVFDAESGQECTAVWNGMTPYANIYDTDGCHVEMISTEWQEGDETDETEWQPSFSLIDLESNGYIAAD